jgi:hypothetical protein
MILSNSRTCLIESASACNDQGGLGFASPG